ncbi:pyridoxamine 5'-phosphate oxidase family protein [Streptomyces lydicus]
MTETPLSSTERSTVRRHNERAVTDRQALYDVLDAGIVCHLGFVVDGAPVVLPTLYGRDGNTLYMHASSGARSSRLFTPGADVCVTVTHVDGIVYGRSVFHHSANYRSAVVHGTARTLNSEAEKRHGMRVLAEHVVPGAWGYARQPHAKELAAVSVTVLDLTEASVKVRTGPPRDSEDEITPDMWAGVLPVRLDVGTPQPDPHVPDTVPVPEHVRTRRL